MRDKAIIVLGGGGHAKVVIDMIKRLRVPLKGMVDPDADTAVLGAEFLGGDDALKNWHPSEVDLANGVGSVGLPELRRELYDRFVGEGYFFPPLVHPASVMGEDSGAAAGAQIMAGAVVQAGADIGENAIVNTRASVDHDCRIGPHSHIAPGATLSGNVRVGEQVHVGTGATVIQGIAIGDRAVIAAGAVVTEDVAADAHVAGVPARAMS